MKFYVYALGITMLGFSLISPELSFAQTAQTPVNKARMEETSMPGLHDFDFLIGHWRVHHRRLKAWLEDSHEWIEFDGTSVTQKLMGGYANVEDNVLEAPSGTYGGVALRSFDAKSGRWSICGSMAKCRWVRWTPQLEAPLKTGWDRSTPTLHSREKQPVFDTYG